MVNVCNAPNQLVTYFMLVQSPFLLKFPRKLFLDGFFNNRAALPKKISTNGCAKGAWLQSHWLKHRCSRQQSTGERQAFARARADQTGSDAQAEQDPYNGAGYKSRRFLPTTSIPSPSWPNQRLRRAQRAHEASPGRARWGRRTCTKWRTTSSSRASSSNRPSAVTAPTSSGEYSGGRKYVVACKRPRRAQVTHLMLVTGKTPKRLNALRHPQCCQHWTKTPSADGKDKRFEQRVQRNGAPLRDV